MSNLALATTNAIESALILGDLSKLTTDQRVSYYNQLCDSLGLNPLTRPFEYIILNGKLTLYAKKDCADQLRNIHKISVKIVDTKKVDDIYLVVAEGINKHGRHDSATGAVNTAGLKGDNLANAFMKAETKAKRRLTLSICGLGFPDETEVSDIPGAKPFVEPNQAMKNVASINEVLKEVEAERPRNPIFNVFKKKEDEPAHAGYFAKFGKLKDKPLKDHDPVNIESYLLWLEKSSADSGQPLKPNQLELLNNGWEYLDSIGHGRKESEEATAPPTHDHTEQMPF